MTLRATAATQVPVIHSGARDPEPLTLQHQHPEPETLKPLSPDLTPPTRNLEL